MKYRTAWLYEVTMLSLCLVSSRNRIFFNLVVSGVWEWSPVTESTKARK